MKINKQDEYGIRILIRLARGDRDAGLSIPQLSELEQMSQKVLVVSEVVMYYQNQLL